MAPAAWGTTYIVTTELLPPGRPMLAATLRALPAGVLVVLIARSWLHGAWWWRSALLGMLNFTAYFPLLFFSAYRLPGGVAATVNSLQPLLVAGWSAALLDIHPSARRLAAGLLGVVGVALLVLTSQARLDALGLSAMLVATVAMALAVVLAKRWGRPPGTSWVAFTGWQLAMGGLALVPVTLFLEGLPPRLTLSHMAGFTYLGTIGTAVAYALWFRGIERLSAASVSFLGLTSPVVATLAGLTLLDQTLSEWQTAGLLLVTVSIAWGQDRRRALRSGG
ncbi:EamA family transporter [Streptomyces sp. V4I23]|uniref:EamA family transporter n=1 Tax=Streptomyces sp. V4I23 TaxID=3042282 RepID=UPI0027D786BA|nr:EamA family transporter [Streptomyces sp. V4I23]